MVTNAVNTGIDYGAYSGVQLSALLDEIQSQKAILDDRERQIRKAISSLDVKSRIGLDEPTEETRNALDNDFVVCRGYSHEEFVESLKNEAD